MNHPDSSEVFADAHRINAFLLRETTRSALMLSLIS